MRFLSSTLMVAAALLVFVDPVYAQDGNAILTTKGLSAFAMAIAAFGGAMGQGKIMSSALDAIGRNPGAAGQMFLPWLLGLAFVESLVIFALLVAAGLI